MPYTVYVNDRPLVFCETPTEARQALEGVTEPLIARYVGKARFLLNYIDMLEKTSDATGVGLYYSDLYKLWDDFKSLYKQISAAGGIVQRPDGKLLFIHRLQRWDLPKGKLEKGETIPEAAVREVEEETGLQEVSLHKPIIHTFHTYKTKKNRVLKETHWYAMHIQTPEPLTYPQVEENIDEIRWLKAEAFMEGAFETYPNIKDVINAYICTNS